MTLPTTCVPPTATATGMHKAVVAAIDTNGYRLSLPDDSAVDASLAVPVSSRLQVGDMVLAAPESSGEWFIVGVLERKPLTTRDGASARVAAVDGHEQIEVLDARGRILFQYDAATGSGTMVMPEGNLGLEAPAGDIALLAGRKVRILSPALQIETCRGDFSVAEGTWTGRRLTSTLSHLRLHCGQVHAVFGNLVERVKNAYRQVAGLQQLTAGRVRNMIRGAWFVRSGRTNLKATDDVRIDGNRINLG